MQPGSPLAQRDSGQGRGCSGVASRSRGAWAAAAAAETMSGQRRGLPPLPRAGSRGGPVARTTSASASASNSHRAAAARLLGGSGSLQFTLALQEPPRAAAEPPPSPPPPSLLPPPVRLGTPSQPPAPTPDNASRGEPPEPSEQPAAPGADGWVLAIGGGGARDTWLRTLLAPGEMITAPSALLECEAQETSTTDEELAGLRAANGSIERRGALSIPDYGEKKLPRARHRGQERRHPRAAGGDPSPPGRAGLRAVGIEPHFFDRNYEKGLEWYRKNEGKLKRVSFLLCLLISSLLFT
ncbi:heparan sulfate glucosamine 3-O-sulfotransferase 4-like [Equus caballus]|uniref:heparan sulfate glucosamine 3-O-sulfotransferase 4-like n=1 Tax=Equus caballus TaxID=9796 RepID=UPI0038B3D6BA